MKAFAVAFLLGIFMTFYCQAQQIQSLAKISRYDMPGMALSYLDQHFPTAKKVKFLKEQTPHTWFYRSDFEVNGRSYSLRFFQSGSVCSIAGEVLFEDLPLAVQKQIEQELGKMFRSFNIQDCSSVNPEHDLHYRLRVRGKNENGATSYESVFNRNGKLISIDVKG